MRFLHTSDWHIGRQFHSVSLLADQEYVLNQLVEIAQSQRVDAILLAGDIYDRAIPPATAVSLLDNIFDRIVNQLNIPLIVITGNHDSAPRLSFAARQLQRSGLHIIGELTADPQPVVLSDSTGEVAIWGLPYADPAQVRSALKVEVKDHNGALSQLIDSIKRKFNSEQRNVVLSHCFIDGASETDSERPLSIGGADRVDWQMFTDFDYVALGHLHGRQYKGQENIRYSGSILKYSFSEEKQIKSVTLVDLDAQGAAQIEQIPLVPLRNMRTLTGSLQQIIDAAANDPNTEDYLLVKLTDDIAILDVMGKLREVYPNVLHLERPGLMQSSSTKAKGIQRQGLSEFQMFGSFFTQIMDRPLSDDETQLVSHVIEKLNREQE